MMPSLFDGVSHSQKVVDGERDALEEVLLDYLTGISMHLKKLQPTRDLFPFTFMDVESQFLHLARDVDAYSGVGTNDHLIKIIGFVQKEASMALCDFERILRWISLKVPPMESQVSSGVHELVLRSVLERKEHMQRILSSLPDYHWKRGEAVSKFGTDHTIVKEIVDDDPRGSNDKARKKTVKSSEKKLRENVNYLRFCVLHDVEWYVKLRLMVEEIRSAHFQVCDVITKNVKQIMDPKNRTARPGGAY